MKPTTRHNLFVAGIFLIAAVVIVLSFPRDKVVRFEFSLNKPWRYEQLTATFDFPVEKSDSVLQAERAHVLTSLKPYYAKDDAVYKVATDSLQHFYQKELSMLIRTSLYKRVQDNLQEIYSRGIINSDDLSRLKSDSINSIMLITNNVAIATPLTELYSVQQAYEKLMQVDTTRYGRYALQNSNLNDYIRPNLVYDAGKSEAARKEALATISSNSGVILAGQKIIGSGEMVDEEKLQILETYRKEVNKRIDERGVQMTFIGQLLLVFLLLAAFVIYLWIYRNNYLAEQGKLLFLVAQLIIFPLTASWMVARGQALMIIPFAMVPVMTNIFLDARTAFMTHTVITLIVSLIVPEPFIFVLVQLTAGIAAIYSLTELTERIQIFRVALVVAVSYCLVFFGYELITKSTFSLFNKSMYVQFLLNGVLLLFTYPLMLLYEKIFHFTSDVTLVELSNTNNKLLRMLSENAPGTFMHAMQVSNLAAAAANKVGASSLLVRTGALYHDIGKLENPVFFTENQGGANPHSCLPYEQSAKIIIDHVNNGVKLAEKHHLPDAIKDFITTHHGMSKAKYFYISYKNEHPNEEVDESLFTYPGPEPYTMETAILMMADAVEAASRSLPEYTEESINALVDRIIDGQVQEGHFQHCPITFKDINDIKTTFKEKLRTVYHTRISYPSLK